MASVPDGVGTECLECGEHVRAYGPYKDGEALLCWDCVKRIQDSWPVIRPRPRRPGMFERAWALVVLGAIAGAAVGACVWVWRLVLG